MSDTLVTLNLEQWTNAVSALVNSSLNVGTDKTAQNAQTILPKNSANSKLLPKLQPAPPISSQSQNLPVSPIPINTIRSLQMPTLMLSLNLQGNPPPPRTILQAEKTAAVNGQQRLTHLPLQGFPLSLPVVPSDSVRPPLTQTLSQLQDSEVLNVSPVTAVDFQSLQSSVHTPNYINIAPSLPTDSNHIPIDHQATNPVTVQMSLPSNGPITSPVTLSAPVLNTIAKDDSHSAGILSSQDCAQIQNTLSTLLSMPSMNRSHQHDMTPKPQSVIHTVSLPVSDNNLCRDRRIDLTGVSLTGRPKDTQGCLGNAPDSAAMALANMSVIDMLLKSQQTDLTSDCNLNHSDVTEKSSDHSLVEHDTSGISVLHGNTEISVLNGGTPGITVLNGSTTGIPVLNGPYCIECNSVESCLSLHHSNVYMEVSDSPILSQARATVPHCLDIRQSSATVDNVVQPLGIWTKETVPARTKFGPLIGKISTPLVKDRNVNEQNFPGWQIFYMDRYDVIDVEDENTSNWMRFVQFARCANTQNLVAHQFGTEVHFITARDIGVDEELFVWYSRDYARLLGVPSTPGMKKLLSCSICGKHFYGVKSLSRHIRQDHPKDSDGKFKCQLCMREFMSSKKLHTHTLVHMGVKPFTCGHCSKHFTDQSNLKTHLAIHSGVKNFSCSVCHKAFRQKAHLQSHMLTHTGERNEECPYCNKMFARTSDLKQHVYQHTKERTFTCSECSKEFYKLQNFKNHLLIHSGERNHMCSKCNKMFYKKYHLQRHFKSCKGAKTEIYLNKHNKAMNIVGMEGVELGASSAPEEQQQVLGVKSCDKNHQLNTYSQTISQADVCITGSSGHS